MKTRIAGLFAGRLLVGAAATVDANPTVISGPLDECGFRWTEQPIWGNSSVFLDAQLTFPSLLGNRHSAVLPTGGARDA
jgi:hypothetical protein